MNDYKFNFNFTADEIRRMIWYTLWSELASGSGFLIWARSKNPENPVIPLLLDHFYNN